MKILFEKYCLFDKKKKLGKIDSTNIYASNSICALIIIHYIHIVFIE